MSLSQVIRVLSAQLRNKLKLISLLKAEGAAARLKLAVLALVQQ